MSSSLFKSKQNVGSNQEIIYHKITRSLAQPIQVIVHPHLEFCMSSSSPHYQKEKKFLEKVQHRFTKMIPGLRSWQYPDRLMQLGLWTLEECRNRADLIEVFKIAHGFSTVSLSKMFQLSLIHISEPRD